MTRKRLLIAAAALVVAALAALLGGALRTGSGASASNQAGPESAAAFAGGFSLTQDTQSIVLQLQAELRARPKDEHSYALLGLAYEQRARETADPAYYTKADGVLRQAVRLAPRDALAVSGLGALAASRHRFRDALRYGLQARALAPDLARTYGVIGDALVELGRYRDAFRAFDTQSRLRPSLSSYARVSYARELEGKFPGAVRAMRLAVDAATGEREPLAWTLVQLGKLYFNHGRPGLALEQYAAALRVFPAYPYALDAVAAARAAQGHLREAVAAEQQAAQEIPLPQYVGQLGDLLHVSGRDGAAHRQYALIDVIQRLLVANGVKTDLETALFDVDHAIRLPHALALARLAHRDRPSIDGDDVVAWALARNGRCGEALGFSEHALRLGTQDALKFFHRGFIAGCLHRPAEQRLWYGRALALNPHFSLLWAPVARKALA